MVQWVKSLHVKVGLEANVGKPELGVLVEQAARWVLLGCLEQKL